MPWPAAFKRTGLNWYVRSCHHFGYPHPSLDATDKDYHAATLAELQSLGENLVPLAMIGTPPDVASALVQ